MKWLARQVTEWYLMIFRPKKYLQMQLAKPRLKDDTGFDDPFIYFR